MNITIILLHMLFLLYFLIISLINSAVVGTEVKINNVDDFILFKGNVNSGITYSGSTVFLDSDLDFNGKTFEPVGISTSNYFRGVFDGQGHVIRNLKMSLSSQYAGLFGYSGGMTIRNVILDSSCSITTSLSDSDNVFIGGISGRCEAKNGQNKKEKLEKISYIM